MKYFSCFHVEKLNSGVLVAINTKAFVPIILNWPAICSTWSDILHPEFSIHISAELWACPHECRAVTDPSGSFIWERIRKILYLSKITDPILRHGRFVLIPLKKTPKPPKPQNINFHTFADSSGKIYVGCKSSVFKLELSVVLAAVQLSVADTAKPPVMHSASINAFIEASAFLHW